VCSGRTSDTLSCPKSCFGWPLTLQLQWQVGHSRQTPRPVCKAPCSSQSGWIFWPLGDGEIGERTKRSVGHDVALRFFFSFSVRVYWLPCFSLSSHSSYQLVFGGPAAGRKAPLILLPRRSTMPLAVSLLVPSWATIAGTRAHTTTFLTSIAVKAGPTAVTC
jgi:hypothetical protein